MDNSRSDHLLGSTAAWTAAVRARESVREDRLFNDPWAAALAGAAGAEWLAQRPPDSVTPIVLRTRFFDDFLQRLATQNGIRQIVLMAAGLDTRAFRLTWPGQTQLFELDQAPVLQFKELTLRAAGAETACARQTIAVDLTGPWREALIGAGFDPQQPSGWLLEGFLFYLPSATVTRLLEEVAHLAVPGSWMGFDIINGAVLTSPWTRPWVEMQAQAGAPWIGILDDPVGFLAPLGWKATLTQAGQPDANHGRWTLPVIPTTLPDMPHNWFVVAQKQEPVSQLSTLSRSLNMINETVQGLGTREQPWLLKTPSGSSEYMMYRDESANPPALVCLVGKTELRYYLRCLDDLHAMLKAHGDWMLLGSADEQKPAAEGTVEAWGRSPGNPVGGWYGLKKGLRGRFGMYVPPLMEALGLAEVEHNPKNNRMRAL